MFFIPAISVGAKYLLFLFYRQKADVYSFANGQTNLQNINYKHNTAAIAFNPENQIRIRLDIS
jgi:hypothetical protein